MATKVNFAYGTANNPIWSSNFTNGMIYFHTSYKKIYLKQNESTTIFDGNNNSGNCKIIDKSGTERLIDTAAVHIQDAPDSMYSSSYTSSISGYSSWYTLFGQDMVASSTVVDYGYNNAMNIDDVLSSQSSSGPVGTLANAKEIVFAVDLINLGRSVNNGTAVSGIADFGFTPADVIVKCYRTTASDHAACNTTDYQDTSGKEMFIGKVLLGLGANTSSSAGAGASLCSLNISLCPNASNAVKFGARIFKIASGSGKNESVSFNGLSGQYQYEEYSEGIYYPNIEKHLYPLYIRYI